MTLAELNRGIKLRERLNRAYDMVESLKEAAVPGAQNLSGMPHAQGVSDKIGDLAVEIADMKRRIAEMEDELEAYEDQVTAFADGTEDERVRLILRLRYIKGLTWDCVTFVCGVEESTARGLIKRAVDCGC